MSEIITILFAGDVVGEPGRRTIKQLIPKLREKYQVDFCVVNGENSAGGAGITPRTYRELRESGVDAVTTGDHVWDNKEVMGMIHTEACLLRAANHPHGVPGFGSVVLTSPKGVKLAVLNLMGRSFIKAMDCPFQAADREVGHLREITPLIFVDVHAETTSEKIALGRFLDGRVTAVVGTHTHVQTADEQIFPGGTAFLCDAGMTGPHESILGREIKPIIERFRTQMPQRFEVAEGDLRLKGVVVRAERTTGKAVSIERVDKNYELGITN